MPLPRTRANIPTATTCGPSSPRMQQCPAATAAANTPSPPPTLPVPSIVARRDGRSQHAESPANAADAQRRRSPRRPPAREVPRECCRCAASSIAATVACTRDRGECRRFREPPRPPPRARVISGGCRECAASTTASRRAEPKAHQCATSTTAATTATDGARHPSEARTPRPWPHEPRASECHDLERRSTTSLATARRAPRRTNARANRTPRPPRRASTQCALRSAGRACGRATVGRAGVARAHPKGHQRRIGRDRPLGPS